MTMYIDTITPSLNAASNVSQGLADMKAKTISQRLQLADMLNRQGKNIEAEQVLNSARNYGLSSIFSPKAQEWEAQGINKNITPADIALKERQAELPGGVNAEQGGFLARLKQNYIGDEGKFDREGYDRQLRVMGLQNKGMSNADALGLTAIANDKINRGIDRDIKDFYGMAALQNKEYKDITSDNELIRKQNADIDKYNAEATAYNKSKPKFADKYIGNMVDQRQQLLDDAMNAMDFAKTMEDKLRIYNKYRTTDQSILRHYQTQDDSMPAAYFGIGNGKSRGGGGEKPKPYNIVIDGQKVGVVGVTDSMLMRDDLNSEIIKRNPNLAKKLNLANANFILDPAGTDTGMNAYEKENTRQKQLETDAVYKQQAADAYKQADEWGWDSDETKATRANAMLPPENPYRYNTKGTIYNTRGNSNVATSDKEQPIKPWKKK